jgi:hypothetical protein
VVLGGSKMIKDKPQNTYIGILYRISNDYIKNIFGNGDLQDEINYYQNKKQYTPEEITNLEKYCKEQWQKLIILICDILLEKCDKPNKSDLYLAEIKRLREIKKTVEKNDIDLEKYETYFYSEVDTIRNKIKSGLFKEKQETKKFWWGLGLGFILGIIGSFIFDFIKTRI